MEFTYSEMTLDGVRGTDVIDYLLDVEQDFSILDGDEVVYSEVMFPVVELAWDLVPWIADPQGQEFLFDSMCSEPGLVAILPCDDGWTVGSVLEPRVMSRVLPWSEVQDCVHRFIACVEADLAHLGVHLR